MDPRCSECPLKGSKVVSSYVVKEPRLVFLGEAPGVHEVKQGRPFVGESGRLLKGILDALSVDFDDCYVTNATLCRFSENKEEDALAVACCHDRLIDELTQLGKPVIAMGNTAISSLLPGMGTITSLRGGWFFSSEINQYVLTTWHPAYVLRRPEEGIELIRDLVKAAKGVEPSMFRLCTPPEYSVLSTGQEVADALSKITGRVCFDFETTQNNWSTDRPMLLTLGDAHMRYIIPGFHPGAPANLLEEDETTKEALRQLFQRCEIVGHNVKYDRHFGLNIGVEMPAYLDTMIGHYVLDERPGTHGLKALAREYFNVFDYDQELVHKYLKRRSDDWSAVPWDELCQYGAWDVAINLELSYAIEAELKEEGLWEWPFRNLLMPAVDSMLKMERTGFTVDVDYLNNLWTRLEEEREESTAQMQVMCGDPEFNPRSPKQVARVVYDERGLERPDPNRWDLWKGRIKVSPNSTSKGALERFAIKEGSEVTGYTDDFLNLLFRYRRADKIQSSYVENLLERADSEGKVHCVVYLHGTETGRVSIREPALQTIPRESTDEYGNAIRCAFVAAPGHTLVICDYSQAELRVFAALTDDPFLMEVYQDGRDLHTEVAKAMFGENWTKEDRMIVKRFNFGYIYGGGFTILHDAQIPVAQAKRFMDDYSRLMKVAHRWRGRMQDLMLEQGYVQSVFGRRRRFPVLVDGNKLDAQHAAINMPVQGPASDLNLISAMRLQAIGLDVKLIIHDSVVVECKEEEAEWTAKKVKEVMEQVGMEFFPTVPWQADPEIRSRWGKL